VQAVQANQHIATVAVAAQGAAARRSLGHVEVLEIRRGKSPLILGDLDPIPASSSHPACRAHPTLRYEEPVFDVFYTAVQDLSTSPVKRGTRVEWSGSYDESAEVTGWCR
jgi:hypothetical protein